MARIFFVPFLNLNSFNFDFCSADDDDDDDDVAKDPEQLEADRRWLESNTEPWTETIQKFKLTLKVRLGHFRRLNLKICEYFLLYPAFLQFHGYTLVSR